MTALKEGKIYLRKTLCDLSNCSACLGRDWHNCPDTQAGPYVEMVDKIAVGESRQSLTSIKQEQKQKKTSELGPEIGVFDISVILKIILCFKFCATSHFFTQKKHFGIHG